MGGATPHGGVEPSVGPKTVVVGFPRVVVVCLLALAELARRKAAAVEGMNLDKVGKAEASMLAFWKMLVHNYPARQELASDEEERKK